MTSQAAIEFGFVRTLAGELSSGSLELPSFPDVALRVKRALEDPEASADRVVRVVGVEPVLSARLLKMANSALLSRANVPVTDVRMAVTRLGFEMVRNAAVSLALEQVMDAQVTPLLQPYLKELWHHSIRVSAIAYVVAKRLTRLNADEAMLGGLLHDIGKLYILLRAESHPELFAEEQALRALLAEWHTGIGRAILESWGFSDGLAQAVDEHEILDRTHLGPPDLTDVVTVANVLAHNDHPERFGGPDHDGVPAFDKLQLTAETSTAILENSEAEMRSFIQALDG
jgi:putative nucleotidyltransferase with HDIG domain